MSLLETMKSYRRAASWAVWPTDHAGRLTEEARFPVERAERDLIDTAMIVSLNPGTDRAVETEENTPDWGNFHSSARKHNDLFLARAFHGTSLWGAYMTDLHPEHAESDSRKVRALPEQIRSSVDSLIEQARLLANVDTIVCLGAKTFTGVNRHRDVIEKELQIPASSIRRVPHYSGAAARVHKNNADVYADVVATTLGLNRARV
ncbi:hypothetical protein [Schumannella soli]|uniref:Uracil-DNA glycosylase n=1 Tax=Schumannella soli TaxID=2590779 RepID=A0A506Y622_9MICO|nr:hypothetical protein [Schumannella soli]TPW76468.1 hypothetical protein FJ657_11950 [Schumannella soli]